MVIYILDDLYKKDNKPTEKKQNTKKPENADNDNDGNGIYGL